MTYLVFGAGLQGRIVGLDILSFEEGAKMIFADNLEENLQLARKIVGSEGVRFVQVDIQDEMESLALMQEADVVINCLPHDWETTKRVYTCLSKTTGKKAVFSDYWLWEKHNAFHDTLLKAEVLVVPGMGIAPGLANICVGQLALEFDLLEEAIIYVGGLPVERGRCVLDYMELFNLEAVLDMYITPAKVIEDGLLVEKPNLTVFDSIRIPGHGEAEVFWTDGLCSLMKTMKPKGLKKLAETTLRWPGHVEKMKELENLGFLSTKPLEVNGVFLKPKDVTEKILQRHWQKIPGVRDLTYLKVTGRGRLSSAFTEKSYELKCYSDEERGITSMERATAYPIAIAAIILAKDWEERYGVIEPENYFVGGKFHEMLRELAKRGLYVYPS